MIKLLLLIPLLIAPVNADDHISKPMCEEMYEIILESVELGQMTNKEATAMYERCKAAAL